MDRLKAANTMLEASLKAAEAVAELMIAELYEEMDRLNAVNTMLEASLKAAEAVLAEERCERDKDKALHALVEQRIQVLSPE